MKLTIPPKLELQDVHDVMVRPKRMDENGLVNNNDDKMLLWACSSIGRALLSHSKGKRFDPAQVHISEKPSRKETHLDSQTRLYSGKKTIPPSL